MPHLKNLSKLQNFNILSKRTFWSKKIGEMGVLRYGLGLNKQVGLFTNYARQLMYSEYHSDADLGKARGKWLLYIELAWGLTHSLTVRARRLIGQDMDLVALL